MAALSHTGAWLSLPQCSGDRQNSRALTFASAQSDFLSLTFDRKRRIVKLPYETGSCCMERRSFVRGETTAPLLEHTIGVALAIARDQFSGPALISKHQEIRWSWSELSRRSEDLAAGLLSLGLRPGDRVGIWGPNSAEWLLAQLATARAGLILVNVNPAYRTAELEYIIKKTEMKALISAESGKRNDYISMLESLVPELSETQSGTLRSASFPSLKHVIKIGDQSRPGWKTFSELTREVTPVQRALLVEIEKALDRNDPINIQFTSGTTGFPKGATLSHRNILNNAQFVGKSMGLIVGDRVCIPVPLYHCFGMVMGNLACVVHGATIVYPSEKFDPVVTLKTVEEESCTALYGVPTMFIAELNSPDLVNYRLSSLRTGLMAGSPCPIHIMRDVVNRMHMKDVGIAYGMTETSPVSFQSSVDDPLELRVSTVGRIQPHLEAKIIDRYGVTMPRGGVGELCVRGYSVMLGYWDDQAQTEEVVDREGWMHTGDLATFDDDGYCNIVGRLKDMVIRGGENIYPREIEEFLFGHPKIESVQVVGVPDLKYGEELCAWIKLRTGEKADAEDIFEFCKGRISHFKIPRYVKFVNDFPMTVTGKVKKTEIRRLMIDELGLMEVRTA
jgi:fatty-acyl-CoA synthase